MDIFIDIFQQHSKKLATLTSLLLVVLLSLSIANGVLFFIENMNDPASTTSILPPKATLKENPNIDLASLNLFGQSQKIAAPSAVDAPETKLNLELQGVFLADQEASSTAIVAEKNKPGELFAIGDRLPGNAVLAAVLRDHILIRRGSRMEKLMFSDSALRSFGTGTNAGSAGSTASSSSQPTTRLQRVQERIAQRNRSSSTARRTAKAPGNSLREYIDANKNKIRENPDELLTQLGMSPVSQGEAKGYKVEGAVSQTSLMQAGLQQGDVILSVNGKPVGDVMNDSAMIEQAMASKRVRVEVQRDSRRFFLTVPIP